MSRSQESSIAGAGGAAPAAGSSRGALALEQLWLWRTDHLVNPRVNGAYGWFCCSSSHSEVSSAAYSGAGKGLLSHSHAAERSIPPRQAPEPPVTRGEREMLQQRGGHSKAGGTASRTPRQCLGNMTESGAALNISETQQLRRSQ